MSAADDPETAGEDEPFIDTAPRGATFGDRISRLQNDPQLMLCVTFVLMMVFLSPSIVGIVIASQYDANTSVCNDGTKYTVNLDEFLYLGCGIHIGSAVFDMLCNLMCVVLRRSAWSGSRRCDGVVGMFMFVWMIIGLNMYNSQMSTQCKNTAIGKMILSWSVIPFCVIGLALIAICVPFCKWVKEWSKTQV